MSNTNPNANANAITVTVELGPESQAKLDKILEALQGIRPNCQRCTETAMQMMGENLKLIPGEATVTASASETAAPETSHPADETTARVDPAPAVAPEQPTEPEGSKYTKADVQALVQKLAAPTSPEHKRTGAKNIVKSYGAKVSDIPEDKYAEVMDKLNKLDKEG